MNPPFGITNVNTPRDLNTETVLWTHLVFTYEEYPMQCAFSVTEWVFDNHMLLRWTLSAHRVKNGSPYTLRNVLLICRIVNSLVYFGLTLASSKLAGDRFVNFALIAAMEIPSAVISYLTMQKYDRFPHREISKKPVTNVAYALSILVPMAVPIVCIW